MESLDLGALGALWLAREDGSRVRLGTLWEKRQTPLVVVWVRHYG